jgi:endonuclease/exonuclease/phosphatase family metal-dependent hydrolase
MRVATYNVHDCIGRDGRYDPERIAALMVEFDADLIALQEVTQDDAGELVELFESTTAMQALDGSLFERGLGRYGNLILARDPVVESRLHDLSCAGREPRACIDLLLDLGGLALRLIATHLGLRSRERLAQLARLADLAAATGEACLLMGDFNLWWHRRALRPLAEQGFVEQPVRSFPTRPGPLVALDRILARPPVTIERCWRYDNPRSRLASDHFPVLADLRLES